MGRNEVEVVEEVEVEEGGSVLKGRGGFEGRKLRKGFFFFCKQLRPALKGTIFRHFFTKRNHSAV